MNISKKFYLTLVTLLVSAALFTACGDSAATIAPATTAATTAAATTTAPATTVAATTAAATTAATTAAATSGNGIPASWKEVTLDPAVVKGISQGTPPNLSVTFKFYGTTEDVATAGNTADAEFTKAGYKYAVPGETKPTLAVDTILGVYTKAGSPDILFTIVDTASGAGGLETSLKNSGVSQSVIDSTMALAKTNKSLITVVSGSGLAQAIFGGPGGTSTPAAIPSTTAVAVPTSATTSSTPATTTVPASSTTAVASADEAGLYPGATRITLPDAIVKQFEGSVGSAVTNPQVAAFTSPDTNDKIKAYYVDLLQKDGWTDIAAAAGAGLSQLESVGGFGMVYSKGKQVVVLIGLPASSATTLGVNAPSSGTLVMGFAGAAK